MKLLPTVNRRIALSTKSVSPYCHVQYINVDDRTQPTSQAFTEKGETVPFEMPILLFGIDLSGWVRRFSEQSDAFHRGEIEEFGNDVVDANAMNEEQKRRP
jgi:hypothetical protein